MISRIYTSTLIIVASFAIPHITLTASDSDDEFTTVTDYGASVDWVLRIKTNPHWHYTRLILYEKSTSEIIGYTKYRLDTGCLHNILVVKKFTRQGYGSLLFRETEKIMRAAKVKTMHWEAIPFKDYSPSIADLNQFYRNLGGTLNGDKYTKDL